MKGNIDVDGVLADFAGALLGEFPIELPENPPWDIIKLYPPEVRERVTCRVLDMSLSMSLLRGRLATGGRTPDEPG